MICPGCRATNPDTAAVCEFCGTTLAMKAQPQQAKQAQAQPIQPQPQPMREKPPQMRAAGKKAGNPLRVYCRNCGAPAGYDIINRTYRCTSCGTATGIKEANGSVENWKVLQKQSVEAPSEGLGLEEHGCPSCGAEILFKPGEATSGCVFCGSKLVRKGFTGDEQMPDLIIPFAITPGEAKERMLAWANDHAKTPEGKALLSSIDQLQGYYLPYRVVRGPVDATVTRDSTSRRYYCAGYLEGVAVNTSKQLDNLVLNDMEPFDWSEAKPFSYGYIAGQPVKMNDSSDQEIEARIRSEVKEDFLPTVEKVMQTSGVKLQMHSGEISVLSALLPAYFVRVGKLTAVMNGQTGRIAVSTERKKKTIPWMIEPIVYTLLITLALGAWANWHPEMIFYSLLIFGAIMFIAFGEGRGSLIRRISMRSEASRARREDGELKIDEAKDILKNPYDNTPVFYEKNAQGQTVPVRIRFYTVGRTLSMLFSALLTMFLPMIIGAVFRLAEMKEGETFMERFHPEYGAAWYTLGFLIVILYFIRGVRQDVYNHPYLYEIRPDGTLKLMGKRSDRKVTVLSAIGIGKPDENGKRISLFRWMRMTGARGFGLVFGLFVILLGSSLAMVF